MAATYAVGEQPTKRDPLAPGASPGAIQAALLPEDQALFDAAYDAALDAPRESPELAALFALLERWRIAVLQAHQDNFCRVGRSLMAVG
jgi:hypothetical protein